MYPIKNINIRRLTLHNISVIAFFIIITLLLFACDHHSNSAVSNKNRTLPVHRVKVVPVVVEPIQIEQRLSGNLQPVIQVKIYNEESARITRLPFHEGDSVKRGDVLVKLDDALIRAEVEKARASFKQAATNLKRQQKLLAKNITTKEEVAQAKTTLALAKADMNYQLIRLSHTTIKAPMAGIITERLKESGDVVPAQTHLLTLIDPKKLQLKLSLAERLLPLVRKNQTVSIEIDSLGEKRFPATIKRIFPTVNNTNHKGTIEVVLDSVPAGIMAGQFAHVIINLVLNKQRVVPTRCIQLEPAGAYVFRVIKTSNGKFKVKKVYFKKGPQYNNKTVVLNKLQAGDKIVIRGFLGLRDNRTVELFQPENNAIKSQK